MSYSCAVFEREDQPLAEAQANKHELICQKLRLEEGQRLLDVGCGWGSMLLHAAQHHGVRGVGVTISRQQYELATKRVADAGLAGQIEIRLQDYRDIADGPFDAISSIGMFEHVGRAKMPVYNRRMFDLLRPGGRFLNHGICRPAHAQTDSAIGRFRTGVIRTATALGSSRFSEIKSPFIQRYVFPDGELHEIGTIEMLMDEAGFEIRHTENLREHYELTLRNWVKNLEDNWAEAAEDAGEGRARVWRLYMAASAASFEHRVTEIHQVLAVKPERGPFAVPAPARLLTDRRTPRRHPDRNPRFCPAERWPWQPFRRRTGRGRESRRVAIWNGRKLTRKVRSSMASSPGRGSGGGSSSRKSVSRTEKSGRRDSKNHRSNARVASARPPWDS